MPLDIKKRKILGLDVIEVPGDEGGSGVVLFHGFGADAYDLLPLSQIYKEKPKPTWFFPNGPLEVQIAPGYVGRAWFEIDIEKIRRVLPAGDHEEAKTAFPSDLGHIRGLGEQLIAELNIPLSKLFLGGFSQGAILSTELALSSFEKVAGLLLFSGTIAYEARWSKLAPQHAGMPFFQSHGIQDPLLPIEGAKQLEKLLLDGKLSGKLHTFHGGHEIPQSVLFECHRFLKKHLAPK